jgi:hypothetical protein
VSESDITLQSSGHKVSNRKSQQFLNQQEVNANLHDQIDTADLIHELHAISKKNTLSGLDLIPLENLAPSMNRSC